MKIPEPTVSEYVIEVPEGTFNVSFRTATVRDEMQRRALFSDRIDQRDTATPTVVQTIYKSDWAALEAREVWLTLESCDLEGKNGQLLFKKGMSEPAFMRAWGSLPPHFAAAIQLKCMETNKDWGFVGAVED